MGKVKPSKPKLNSKTRKRSAPKKETYSPFTADQVSIMNTIFNENRCPSKEVLEYISSITELTLTQVKNWFSNRRRAVFGTKACKPKILERKEKRTKEWKMLNELIASRTDTESLESKANSQVQPQFSFLQLFSMTSFILSCILFNQANGWMTPCDLPDVQEVLPLLPNSVATELDQTNSPSKRHSFSIENLLQK